MNTDELKINLINKITSINDSSLLEEVKQLLDFETNESVYQLSDEQKNRIAEARAEYKAGNFLTIDEANNEIEKWLEE
ncbi:MAG: hypothetical protein PW786_15395 [Arachidicoccus sp.]|nr:hypothetical protein [Arachidicoccus sp.]